MQSLPPIIDIRTIDDVLAAIERIIQWSLANTSRLGYFAALNAWFWPAQFPPPLIRVVKSSSRRVFESFRLTTRRLEGSSTHRLDFESKVLAQDHMLGFTREEAWGFATQLAAIPAAQQPAAIGARDVSIAGVGSAIIAPPKLLERVIVSIALLETRDVTRIIETLNEQANRRANAQ